MADKVGIDSTGTRRVKYGLNVLVALVVAVLIAVVINAIAYNYLDRARFDTTHSRKYSLSDQTRKLLRNLENEYRIVTLIARSRTEFEEAKDLIQEYDHDSSKLSVDHLNPTTSRGDQFYKSLLERFEQELGPVREAIKKGLATISEARKGVAGQRPALDELYQDPEFTDPQRKRILRQVISYLGRFDQDTENIDNYVEQRLDGALPDLTGILTEIQRNLDVPDQAMQQASEKFFRIWAQDPTTPDSMKNRLLKLADQFDEIRQEWTASLKDLRDAAASEAEGYSQLRRDLANPDTVVVMGKNEVRVIDLNTMFRAPTAEEKRRGQPGQAQTQFTGEEQITGALVSMELDQKPLVVLVNSGGPPNLGPGGMFTEVADRLRTMNFDVREWSPTPQQGGFGRPPAPPQSPPVPEPGQKVVWVVPMRQSANPGGMPPQATGGQRVADMVRSSLTEGQGALVMFAADPMAMMSGPDPLKAVVEDWGIKPQTDRQILRRMVLSDRTETADSTIMINDWPDGLAVTKALSGMQGVFPRPCPLQIDSEQDKQVKHYVLAEAKTGQLWAETDMFSETPRYDASKAAEKFTIATAAEKDKGRLIVVADAFWASDQVTTYGYFGRGTASITGAQFPANAELFTNSVYWLAGLDQLIAASARTQDIRRIDAMSPGGLAMVRWGLPLVMSLITVGAGVGVWIVRRS